METRSKSTTRNESVQIDFDEASLEWRKNKKSIGNGMFVYKCIQCSQKPFLYSKFCKKHHPKNK